MICSMTEVGLLAFNSEDGSSFRWPSVASVLASKDLSAIHVYRQ